MPRVLHFLSSSQEPVEGGNSSTRSSSLVVEDHFSLIPSREEQIQVAKAQEQILGATSPTSSETNLEHETEEALNKILENDHGANESPLSPESGALDGEEAEDDLIPSTFSFSEEDINSLLSQAQPIQYNPLEDIKAREEKERKEAIAKIDFGALEKDAFEKALLAVVEPISNQIDTKLNKSAALDKDPLLSLIAALSTIFPKADVEHSLNELKSQSKTQNLILHILKKRKYDLDNDVKYKKEDFQMPEIYEYCKSSETRKLDAMIKEATVCRQKASQFFLEISLTSLLLDKSSYKNSEIYFVVEKQTSSRKKGTNIPGNEQQVELKFEDQPILLFMDILKPIQLVVYYKGLLKNEEIGHVTLDMQKIYETKFKYHKYGTWGRHSYKDNLNLVAKGKAPTSKGTAALHITIQYQSYYSTEAPESAPTAAPETPNRSRAVTSLDDINLVYEVLLSSFLNHFIAEHPDAAAKASPELEGFLFFAPEEQFILTEFSKLYGIPEVHAKLTFLKLTQMHKIAKSPLLMEEVKKSIEYVLLNNQKLATQEMQYCAGVVTSLTEKIDMLLSSFIHVFPDNLPPGAVEQLVNIYKILKMDVERLTKLSFSTCIQQVVAKAIHADYDFLKRNIKFMLEQASADQEDEEEKKTVAAAGDSSKQQTTVMMVLSSKLFTSIENMYAFSKVFNKEFSYDSYFIKAYYVDHFEVDLMDLLKQDNLTKNSYGILQLCYQIVTMNKRLQDDYDDDLYEVDKLIDVSKITQEFLEHYILQIKKKLARICRRAVRLETPLKGIYHTSSVVDLFSAMDQYYEALKEFEFTDSNFFETYEKVVQAITLQYARINESFFYTSCFSKQKGDVSSLVNSTTAKTDAFYIVSDKAIHKLNNLAAAREQLSVIINRIRDEKKSYFGTFEGVAESELTEETAEASTPSAGKGSAGKEDKNDDDEIVTEMKVEPLEVNPNDSVNQTFQQLNSMLYGLVDLMGNQFKNAIQSLVVQLLNLPQREGLLVDLDQPTTYEKIKTRCEDIAVEFLTDFIDRVLSPNLQVLNVTVQPRLFKLFLQKLYGLFIQTIVEHILPYSSSITAAAAASSQSGAGAAVHYAQIIPIECVLVDIFDYFHGGGKGLPKKIEKLESRFLRRILKAHKKTTKQLIDECQKRIIRETQSSFRIGRENTTVLSYHFYMILQTRVKYDTVAMLFVNNNKQIIQRIYAKTKLRMDHNVNGEDKLILKEHVWRRMNDSLCLCDAYLYETYMMLEKSAISRSRQVEYQIFKLSDVDKVKLVNQGLMEFNAKLLKVTLTFPKVDFYLKFQQQVKLCNVNYIDVPSPITPMSPVPQSPASSTATAPFSSLAAVTTTTTPSTPTTPISQPSTPLSFEDQSALLKLLQQLRHPVNGVKVGTRIFQTLKFDHCFVGSELVDYIASHKVLSSRKDAVDIANKLFKAGFLEHSTKSHKFEDGYFLYRFTQKKQVYILGGGFAGARIAKSLEKLSSYYQVTLVAKNLFFEAQPTFASLLVNPAHAQYVRANYSKFLKNTEVVQATVVSLDPTARAIQLDTGATIHYTELDHVIIATGSSYQPDKIKLSTEDLKVKVVNASSSTDIVNAQFNILEATNIVIVGSGPVAVEMAGELAAKYPKKTVTIISKDKQFVSRFHASAHHHIFKHFMRCQNVKMYLNDRVRRVEHNYVLTKRRRKIEAQVVIVATGFHPNTEFVKEPLMLSDDGYVKVNAFFQVEGHTHLWAVGDAACLEEEKLAQNAEAHAEHVIKNLDAYETGTGMKMYKAKKEETPVLLSLGPKSYMLVQGNKVVTDGQLKITTVKNLVDYKMMAPY